MLFPLAPFRTLQPEEATQVLSPLSGTILLDRQKVAIARHSALRSGGNRLDAAFLESGRGGLAVLQRGPNPPARSNNPTSPCRRRALCCAFSRVRRMRALGPQEPDLARGCIAFAPASSL